MIVKKLSDVSGGGFPGAKYNEDKVAAGVAELMLMENVSGHLRHTVALLHRFGLDAGTEIGHYLKECSKTYGNTKTTRFQFHVSASVKGRTMSSEELSDFARKLMQGMGYGNQPYFVYAHHDTDNNHVHILSTRIQPNGYPISDHQDRRRLNACANRILASDISKEIDRIFSFDYETEGQFANIVRAHGYTMEKSLDGYRLFKCGGDAGAIAIGDILNRITKNSEKRKDRAVQLRAIIRKYKAEISDGKCQNVKNVKVSQGMRKKHFCTKPDSDIKKIIGSNGNRLTTDEQTRLQQLLDILKTRLGIDIFFQKDRNGQVRGYGIVDHTGKMAFDGSRIMKLSELTDFSRKQKHGMTLSDIFQNLFDVAVKRTETRDLVSIRMKDGSIYSAAISVKQYSWYNDAKHEERQEVAYRIAASMLSEQILAAYLNQATDFKPAERIKSVASLKQRDGNFAYRITFTDGYTAPAIRMSAEENDRYRSLDSTGKQSFLMKLAEHHLTYDTAQELVKRIRHSAQMQAGTNSLPLRRQEYSPEVITTISQHIAQVIQRFNVSTGHGQNREWEVGQRNSYDYPDDRQSGTKISM